MIALYIIGGILLFFFLIAIIRAEVVIIYNDEFALTVKVAGIPIKIIPKKPKKIKNRDYTPKAIEKKRKKAEKKAEKKALKKAAKKKKKAEQKEKEKKEAEKRKAEGIKEEKKDVIKIIKLISGLVGVFFKRFGKHIRIRIARLHINVASDDAAKTAILYGTVYQSVCYLATLLDAAGTLRHPQKTDMQINADYLSEKISVDIEIGISLCVWQVFDMINFTGAKYIKELIKSNGQLF